MMTHHALTSGAPAQTLVRTLVGVTLAGLALVSASSSASDYTDTKAYVVPVSTDYSVLALLSVGDQVPNTRNPALRYQMIGIPDGLGMHKTNNHRSILYMNHELGNTVLSEPNIGGTRQRGAFVSRWVLDRHARVISGELAYDVVFDEETASADAASSGKQHYAGFCPVLLSLAFMAGSRVRSSDLLRR